MNKPWYTEQDQDDPWIQKMLEDESRLLKQWFDEQKFVNAHPVAGCELEAWLIDERGIPAPLNVECLEVLDSDEASPELSQFNVELRICNCADNKPTECRCGIIYLMINSGYIFESRWACI